MDDGSGIDDFGNLLAIAKSGWNEAIQKDESPYGAGFLSALFAAEHLTVSSRGKTMRGKTADIIERLACPIEPDPQAPKKGTIVTLQRPVSAFKVSDVEYFLRGFPIPVLINGKQINRDRAHEGNFDDTPIGNIRMRLDSPNWVAYLQGMQIASTSIFDESDGVTVVHLDPTRFKGRMPDRDQLIEHEHQVTVIESEIRALARRQLLQMREDMPAGEFAQLTKLFDRWRCWDLLNAVDVLPHSVFSRYEDLPTYGKPWDSGIEEARDVETARGKITTCINRIWCDENWLQRTYACALGLNMIKLDKLDDEHWAHREVQILDFEDALKGDNILNLTVEDIEIVGECIATERCRVCPMPMSMKSGCSNRSPSRALLATSNCQSIGGFLARTGRSTSRLTPHQTCCCKRPITWTMVVSMKMPSTTMAGFSTRSSAYWPRAIMPRCCDPRS
ncbi:MAG: hypothetical protein IPO08_24115 [Xanthomonadales bacterium]|nr:hypothetical protein [Xanthomonadales bacterium]